MGKKHYRSRGSLELVQEVPLSANGAGVTGNFGQVTEDAQGGRIFVACRGAGELLCAHLHSGRTWSFTGASNEAHEPWGLHYLDLSKKLLVSCLATEAVYVVGPNHRNLTWDEQVPVTMPGFIRRATRCETFYTTSQASKQSELIVLGVSPLKVLQRVPLPASVGDFAITFDGMLAVVNLVETSEVALISLNPETGLADGQPLRRFRAPHDGCGPLCIAPAPSPAAFITVAKASSHVTLWNLDDESTHTTQTTLSDCRTALVDPSSQTTFFLATNGTATLGYLVTEKPTAEAAKSKNSTWFKGSTSSSHGDDEPAYGYTKGYALQTGVGACTGHWSPSTSQLIVAVPQTARTPAHLQVLRFVDGSVADPIVGDAAVPLSQLRA
jgi:hypothetical protein